MLEDEEEGWFHDFKVLQSNGVLEAEKYLFQEKWSDLRVIRA